jgi:phosphate transport system permease protein
MTNIELLPRPAGASPWKIRSSTHVAKTLLASTLPVVIAFVIGDIFQIPGPITLLLIFLPLQFLFAGLAAVSTRGRRGLADSVLNVGVLFATAFITIMLGSVLFSVASFGFKAMSAHFVYQNNEYITTTTSLGYGGAGHALLGTTLIVGIATLISVPLGIAVAVYLTETRGRFRGPVRFFAQSMSGLPSVVAGLFIYSVFIATGFSRAAGWLGALALALLMLPTVIRMSEEVLKLVPGDLRSAALALGAPQRRAFFQVIMPVAKTGLVTAILLGIARVVGETAPLVLTTRLASQTNANPLSGDMASLPLYIFGFLTAGFDTGRARAWGAAFLLLVVVGLLFAATRALTSQKTK